jgi:hypothetical protein
VRDSGSQVDRSFVTLGVNFNALDKKCYDWYQESSDKAFYCAIPDAISLLDIVSWSTLHVFEANNRVLIVLIYIIIAVERVRSRHGRRRSRQEDSIALFTLEHRGQSQMYLRSDPDSGFKERLKMPDLGGGINWPFKNDITVQGRPQRLP